MSAQCLLSELHSTRFSSSSKASLHSFHRFGNCATLMNMEQQMQLMECSDQESADGSERMNEEWEAQDQTEMDYQEEYVEEGSEADVASDIPARAVEVRIHSYRQEILTYEEIIKNQVDNTVELQDICEKIASTLNQIPAMKESYAQLLQQALSEIEDLRNNQSETSELINYTVQIYDDNMALICSAKENFAILKRQNYEHITVFEVDMMEFAATSDSMVSEIENRTTTKREFSCTVNHELSEMERTACRITEVNANVDALFKETNDLNRQLVEDHKSLDAMQGDVRTLQEEVRKKHRDFTVKMDEYNEKILLASTELSNLRGKMDKICMEVEKLIQNAELKSRLSLTIKNIADLTKEKHHKTSTQLSLSFQKTELHDQLVSISKTLTSLTRMKNMIGSEGASEIKSLEVEFERMTKVCKEHEEKYEEKIRRIATKDESMEKAQQRKSAMEVENNILTENLSKLRLEYGRERKRVGLEEKRLSEEISSTLNQFTILNKKIDSLSDQYQQCETKLAELESCKVSLQDALNAKNEEVSKKESYINYISRELEQCQTEWNPLIEEKRQVVEHTREVQKLNDEMSVGKKELTSLSDSKMLLKMKEDGNRKIKEIIIDMETKKQEFLSVLRQKAEEAGRLENETKSLQTELSSATSSNRDAHYQAELFNCEQSLLTTFAQWVFDSEGSSVGRGRLLEEPWVSSTSEEKLVEVSEAEANEDPEPDFHVREIRVAKPYRK